MSGYKFKVVYTSDVTGVDEDLKDSSSEFAFHLDQNYPNPFNVRTDISYSIKDAAFVVLKVYDELGNEIGILVSRFQRAGDYNIAFDAGNICGGVYFYRLNVDGFLSPPKKMLFSR